VTNTLKAGLLGLIASLAILTIPVTLQAQNPGGRFLLSPFTDAVIACNPDGSNCFNVVANGSNHGDSEDVSGASQPSVAQNGAIAFQALWTANSTCIIGAQSICWPHVF